MAGKPTPKETVDKIVSAWRTGEYTQRELAFKFKVSSGLVAKLTKGVAQDVNNIVSAGVQYKQGLAVQREQSAHIVDAIEAAVDERTKHIQFFTNAAIKNVQEALKAPCDGQQDFKARADTIIKGKETVLGKPPDTAIQINNGAMSLSEFYGET
ncbi:MAG: hypothetical protein ACXW1U_16455 [Methylobacter sp.]